MENSEFVVFFDQIPPGGIEGRFQIDDSGPGGIDLAVTLDGPLDVEFEATKHGGSLLLRGRVRGKVELECSRCLGTFSLPVEGDLDTLLETAGVSAPEADRELSPDEVDVLPLAEGFVDLRELVAEQVHLAIPVKPLCSEGCRGLCALCGADLNRGTCTCSPERTDPRWEALKKLKTE